MWVDDDSFTTSINLFVIWPIHKQLELGPFRKNKINLFAVLINYYISQYLFIKYQTDASSWKKVALFLEDMYSRLWKLWGFEHCFTFFRNDECWRWNGPKHWSPLTQTPISPENDRSEHWKICSESPQKKSLRTWWDTLPQQWSCQINLLYFTTY